MKLISITFVLAIALVFSGCAGAKHGIHVGAVSQTAPTSGRQIPAKLETISYTWEDYGVDVSFCKRDRDSSWGVTVRDSWDIYEQSKTPGKVWGLSASRCSKEECLR